MVRMQYPVTKDELLVSVANLNKKIIKNLKRENQIMADGQEGNGLQVFSRDI